jgi:hypothetical protein
LNVSSTLDYLIDSIEYNHAPKYLDKDFLHQKYVVEGLSTAQIASQIFSSKDSVQKGLRLVGIPARVPHQPHGRQSQPRYGQKRVEGKVGEHKTEQRVINAVREMRANGLTLRAIASCLGEMKVPTKCRGKKWHPEMVKRILGSGT